jgi:serine/threonine-protein kinase
MTFEVGATVSEKYRIERKLGHGGMGSIWQARHLLLERSVALKVLHPELSEPKVSVERLIREGRALAQLRGDHIARVIDVEVSNSGLCFLVLEYLEGCDLGTLVRETGPLAVSTAIEYVVEVCKALAEAHAKGIVHRDIKPSNLILTTLPTGRCGIKVIDFGISKETFQCGELTRSGAILGSPGYMAPEQIRAAGTVDARSDIWSLGVTLFELLTGERPYNGSSALEICAAILESSPKSIRTLRSGVPNHIDAVVRRCLELNPANRFSSVRELAISLAVNGILADDKLEWCLSSITTPRTPSSQVRVVTDFNATKNEFVSGTIADRVTKEQRKRPVLRGMFIVLVCSLLLTATLIEGRRGVWAIGKSKNKVSEVKLASTVPSTSQILPPVRSIRPMDLQEGPLVVPPHSSRVSKENHPQYMPAGKRVSVARQFLGYAGENNAPKDVDRNNVVNIQSTSSALAPSARAAELEPIFQYGHY